MKTIVIAIAFVLLLSGCNDTNNNLAEQKPSPKPTPEQTKTENQVLSTYSTKLLDKAEERINNIELSIEKINSLIIQPGEVFSFNNTVGPRTQERGFEESLIIVDEEKVKGFGGGICQVSTTIYNAALGAELEIIERHEHDAEVGYVKLGDDATVSYGELDLKIKNTKEIPIRFKVEVNENTVDAAVVTAKE